MLDMNISIVDQFCSTVVWIRFEHKSKQGTPIFVAACYIPPESSVFYKKEKVDIFDYLEESYCSFHRKGHIYVVGDFNARCGTLDDFISDDKLEKSV